MHAAYPHLSDGDNVAPFMRTMIQRLCAVPEELWFTRRDKTPDEDYADESLRKAYNRGVTKTLARKMLAKPTRENFIDSLDSVNGVNYEAADEVKAALAEAIAPFTDEPVDADNVGEILFDLIQESLNFIVDPELETERKIQRAKDASRTAKGKYGSRLLEECKHTCSQIGCGKALQVPSDNGVAHPNYEVARISGDKAGYDNLIVLCPDCFHAYSVKHKKTDETQLKKIKNAYSRSAHARQTLTTVDIERGITKVVESLGRAKPKDFEELTFEPVAVKEKIDEDTDHFLLDDVLRHVTRYFRFIEKQLQEQARLGAFEDDLLRAQIKASYRKLAKQNLDKLVIYDEMVNRLSQITKQDPRYCAFLISYFIQSCEVFDAAS